MKIPTITNYVTQPRNFFFVKLEPHIYDNSRAAIFVEITRSIEAVDDVCSLKVGSTLKFDYFVKE